MLSHSIPYQLAIVKWTGRLGALEAYLTQASWKLTPTLLIIAKDALGFENDFT